VASQQTDGAAGNRRLAGCASFSYTAPDDQATAQPQAVPAPDLVFFGPRRRSAAV